MEIRNSIITIMQTNIPVQYNQQLHVLQRIVIITQDDSGINAAERLLGLTINASQLCTMPAIRTITSNQRQFKYSASYTT